MSIYALHPHNRKTRWICAILWSEQLAALLKVIKANNFKAFMRTNYWKVDKGKFIPTNHSHREARAICMLTMTHTHLLALMLTSEEVRSRMNRRNHSLIIWHGIKQLRMFFICWCEGQYRSHISSSITVVWCWPDSDQFSIKHILDTFIDKLMCSTNEF